MSLSFRRTVYPTIYAENIDNPNGTLNLRQAGSIKIAIENTVSRYYQSIKLWTGINILDKTNAVLLAPDNSGGITTLANVANSPTFNSIAVQQPFLKGVANIQYVPAMYYNEITNVGMEWAGAPYAMTNKGADDLDPIYALMLPTTAFGKKLYVGNVRVGMNAADTGDYIFSCQVRGINYGASTQIHSETSDHKTPENIVFDFNPAAADSYAYVLIKIAAVCTNAADLQIRCVEIECYYDT